MATDQVGEVGYQEQRATLDAANRVEPSILTTAKGGSILFSSRLVAYGIRFLIGIILARALGPEELGLYGLALTTVNIVAGFSLLGLNAALVRFVSLYASRKDEAGLWGTLQVGMGLPTVLSLLAAAGLFVLAAPIADGLYGDPRLVPLLRIGSFLLVLQTLLTVAAAATRGSKAMHYSALAVQIVVPGLRLAFVVVLAVTVRLTAASALGTYGAAMLAGALLALFFVDRLYSLRRPPRDARRDYKELMGFALPLYGSRWLSSLGGNLRTVLLGALSTTTNVGIFSVASQVNTLGAVFHASITLASAPVVSELHDRGELGSTKRLYQTASKWTFTLNFPLFLIVVLFPQEILSVFGAGYVGGETALTILAWANLVNTGTGIAGVVIDMTGHTRLRLMNSAASLAMALGLGVLLIPAWGVNGAALGALVSATFVNLLLLTEAYVLLGFLPYNAGFLKPVGSGLAALLAGLGAYHLLSGQGAQIRAGVAAALLLVTYAATLLRLGLSPEDRAVLARFTPRLGLNRWGTPSDEESSADGTL